MDVGPKSTRQRILELYSDGKGKSVRAIAAELEISTQAVYRHLRDAERDGQIKAGKKVKADARA